MKRIICISFFGIMAAMVIAPSAQSQTVLDGAWIKEHNKTKKVVQYPFIREADVMWSKRIWQDIDLREKMNLPLYYPMQESNGMKSLFDVIRDALLIEGSITAYSTGVTGQEDDFRTPLLVSDVKYILEKPDTTSTEDPDTGEMIEVIQVVKITGDQITRYRIKEDWFFDKQRSERYIRIIGIAPQKERIGNDGELTGAYETLFWLYFPECRYVFANWDSFNRFNDAERRSFDDLFQKRMFSSTIVKESNVYDRKLDDVYTGLDRLLKSEEIKEKLFIAEHDLWSY
ncbi:gliding motility protein GldN [Cryomorpha ignava]|uniref:Gliding motility protein GldN n=1 Tax=Cryomorpha ignava TaxID=101383 RepID=A0A7K3WMY0_9FLAO|nr:gliding motility protein GldN [Cryomorpha ignava]NEN23010.1 gliding motility protein GldN [Cryomorpha ignava]